MIREKLPENVKHKLYFAKSSAGIFAAGGVGAIKRDAIGHALTYKRRQLGKLLRHERVGDLSYFVGGQGPNLVFIHGFSDQAGSWADTVALLSRKWRVIVLDLPGHGDSGPPSGDFANDIEGQYQGMERALAMLLPQHERATLVGNSMGGWLSLMYALRQPQRVTQTILINSAGLAHPVDPELLMPQRREMARAKIEAVLGPHRMPKLPGVFLDAIMSLTTPFYEELFEGMAQNGGFVDELLPQLEVPATLIWGAHDPLFPLDYALRMAKLIPERELIVNHRWGHSPQMSHPDELAPLLEKVVRRGLSR